jgi:hypothetical protein
MIDSTLNVGDQNVAVKERKLTGEKRTPEVAGED